jgi:TrmH family RNA methyltransferase
MLNRSELAFLKSLHRKKRRQETGLFLAEGRKVVGELLSSPLVTRTVYATARFEAEHPELRRKAAGGEWKTITARDFTQLTSMENPQEVLAVAEIPAPAFDPAAEHGGLILVLDDVSDPGNLGTLLRVADWFGIDAVICSPQTVDAYNPKVVQAAMGSLFRLRPVYLDLEVLLERNAATVRRPVYGTVLDGENLYAASLEAAGYVLMGKEASGIHPALLPYVTHRLTIPAAAKGAAAPESLNVAVAAAVVCSEFRRRRS